MNGIVINLPKCMKIWNFKYRVLFLILKVYIKRETFYVFLSIWRSIIEKKIVAVVAGCKSI